jgi:hypothetical protein
VEVGFGITDTGSTNGAPLQPLNFGVMVKLTLALGHTMLDNGTEMLLPIARPVPD